MKWERNYSETAELINTEHSRARKNVHEISSALLVFLRKDRDRAKISIGKGAPHKAGKK